MARDRLAAMRAQQQGASNLNSNSYPTQSTGGQATSTQQDNGAYEMAPAGGDSMTGFYTEIASIQDSIRTFNDNVARINDLHSRSLNNTDEAAGQRNAAQLEEYVEDTRTLSADLKGRINALERQGGTGRDAEIRRQQTALVKAKFVEAIQQYQNVEYSYRTKYRQRMERQFKIVKPEATDAEVAAVVNGGDGDQIFSQALMNSDRYGESRAAYREVQERHEDIKKIERTIAELAQLFVDMSVLVDQQTEPINQIEAVAGDVERKMEQGDEHLRDGVKSAQAARRKRWICFFIFLAVLIVAGIIIAVVVTQRT